MLPVLPDLNGIGFRLLPFGDVPPNVFGIGFRLPVDVPTFLGSGCAPIGIDDIPPLNWFVFKLDGITYHAFLAEPVS